MALIQHSMDDGDDDQSNDFAQAFGVGQADQTIRQAIMCCWMALPKSRKTMDDLEKEFRRLVDRAMKDYREDHERFYDPQ